MAATRIACPYAATQRERKWRRAGARLGYFFAGGGANANARNSRSK